MAKASEYLNAQELGARLGITAARVRQLVDEKKLPEPTSFGVRANLWHRSVLEVFESAARGDGRITGQAALLAPATSPLHRSHDVLHFFSPRPGGDPWIVHVRIFTGKAPEGPRTIVLISRLSDRPYADTFIEQIVESIDDQYLCGRGVDATWIEVYSQIIRSVEHSASNLILTRTESLSRRNRKLLFDARTKYCDPIWAPLSISDLDELLGFQLEWWPPQAYTRANVQLWQRQRHELSVDFDPTDIAGKLSALHALDSVASTRAFAAATEIARHMLEADDELVDIGMGDGTDTPSAVMEWPKTWAARLRVVTLTPDQRKGLEERLRGYRASVDDLGELLNDLREWEDELFLSADPGSSDLGAAVSVAIESCQRHLLQHGEEGWLAAQPRHVSRIFELSSEADRQYMRTVTWDNSPMETLRVRDLRNQFEPDVPTGVDRSGNTVVRSRDETEFGVQWPVFPNLGLQIRDDAWVVTGGQAGDQPAYIEQDNTIIGLIAISPFDLFSQRSVGRGGGGPFVMAEDISRHFEILDGKPSPRNWVLDQVENSDPSGLRLSVRELRKRAGNES